MAIIDSEKAKVRRGFAIFFILVGFLIVTIGGMGNNFIYKHYKGKIENYTIELKNPNSPCSRVNARYPLNVGNIGSTFYYDFYKHDIIPFEGLSFVVDFKGLLSFGIIGLLYIWLGIHGLRNKDFFLNELQ